MVELMFLKKFHPDNNPDMEFFETIIGPKTTIYGRIATEVSLRIDGKVVGNIESVASKGGGLPTQIAIAIGEGALVTGDLRANRILIAGSVQGNVYATERVELLDGAKVIGDITYGEITISKKVFHQGMMISVSHGVEKINLS